MPAVAPKRRYADEDDEGRDAERSADPVRDRVGDLLAKRIRMAVSCLVLPARHGLTGSLSATLMTLPTITPAHTRVAVVRGESDV